MVANHLSWLEAQQLITEHTEEIVSDELVQQPLLSVCVITYNHAKYVREALDSILSQITTVPFEIVVGDDCSTDGTKEILLQYQLDYPKLFRLLLSKRRLGEFTGNGQLNFIRVLSSVRGEYVACLEGDDFWSDDHKISSQIQTLKLDPKIAMVCHRVEYVFQEDFDQQLLHEYDSLRTSDGKMIFPEFTSTRTLTWQELLKRNTIQTCSIMYRKSSIPSIPHWMLNLAMGDWPLCLHAATQGIIRLDPVVMAKYRLHGKSYWSSETREQRSKIVTESLAETFLHTGYQQRDLSGSEIFALGTPILFAHHPKDRKKRLDWHKTMLVRLPLSKKVSYLVAFIKSKLALSMSQTGSKELQ